MPGNFVSSQDGDTHHARPSLQNSTMSHKQGTIQSNYSNTKRGVLRKPAQERIILNEGRRLQRIVETRHLPQP